MTAPERTWETSRLLAKPAAIADAQVVFDDYASDPAVAKYMTWTPHRSVADTKEFLSRCERVWIEGSPSRGVSGQSKAGRSWDYSKSACEQVPWIWVMRSRDAGGVTAS